MTPSPDRIRLKQAWIPLALSACMAVGMLVGYRLDDDLLGDERPLVQDSLLDVRPDRIEELLRYIDARYVDEIDEDELTERTVEFILSQLDPYSSYISADELSRYERQISGNYDGLGIELEQVDSALAVFYVYPESPSAAAGLQAGDKILAIDGELIPVDPLGLDKIESLLSEQKEYQLRVERRSGNIDSLMIRPGKVIVNSVSARFMIEDSIAYVKLDRFTTNSYRDVMEAIEYLDADTGKVDDLILDLRSNLGGVLREAVRILQQFYPEPDKLLVYTTGDHNEREEYRSTGKVFFPLDRIAILINNASASASEVIAGAVQDTERGIIIGDQSYGKGLVQEHYKLRDGGELRLTIARYYTPSGRLIQRPYQLPGLSTDSIRHSVDSTTFQTASGRPLIAGGGIAPDLAVHRGALDFTRLPKPVLDAALPIVLERSRIVSTVEDQTQTEQLATGMRDRLIDVLGTEAFDTELAGEYMIYLWLRMRDLNDAHRYNVRDDEAIALATDYLQSDKKLSEYLREENMLSKKPE